MREWSVLKFGKFAGKTLPQIVLGDPDWFFWAMEEGLFWRLMVSESEEINRKARGIALGHGAGPTAAGVPLVLDVVLDAGGGRVAAAFIVPEDTPQSGIRLDRIDLSIARWVCPRDKGGNQILLKVVKKHLFGPRARMTRARCDAFFSNGANFVQVVPQPAVQE
jgi:hypothetical protein